MLIPGVFDDDNSVCLLSPYDDCLVHVQLEAVPGLVGVSYRRFYRAQDASHAAHARELLRRDPGCLTRLDGFKGIKITATW
jgi:hypothetical protein